MPCPPGSPSPRLLQRSLKGIQQENGKMVDLTLWMAWSHQYVPKSPHVPLKCDCVGTFESCPCLLNWEYILKVLRWSFLPSFPLTSALTHPWKTEQWGSGAAFGAVKPEHQLCGLDSCICKCYSGSPLSLFIFWRCRNEQVSGFFFFWAIPGFT